MADQATKIGAIVARLRQEFIDAASRQLDDLAFMLDQIVAGRDPGSDALLALERSIHSIKGQGATFGFPLTGRVAHMLEDYLQSVDALEAENIGDIRIYLDLIAGLIGSDDCAEDNDVQRLFRELPRGRRLTNGPHERHETNILMAMPEGPIQKWLANALLSSGFRVMRVYDSVEAVSVVTTIVPDVVLIDADIAPISSVELISMFAAIEKMRGVRIVLLTGDGDPGVLPTATVAMIRKRPTMAADIESLIVALELSGTTSPRP